MTKIINPEYDRHNKINEYTGYLKTISGGVLVLSLFSGNNVASGISFGAYLIGDIGNRVSRRKLNGYLREGLERTLKK